MKLSDIQFSLSHTPAPDLLTGGQPTQADFEALAAAGLKHVINLRPITEDAGFDEAALAAKLGLTYTNIPVAGPADIGDDNARKLDAALASTKGEPALVHCASSNRVAALLALRAAHIQGKSTDEALAFGRAAGLTKMEPLVQELLQRK
ncbi:MAG: beta-lactamase hydrolase domain-containing protein [Panacagrimonas sp.]